MTSLAYSSNAPASTFHSPTPAQAPATPLQIGAHRVGPSCRTFIVAEIGVNHDGSLERALQLVEIAASAGADAIKLQLFRADTLLHSDAAFAAYQKDTCPDAPTPADMLRRYELPDAAVRRIITRARDLNLVPLATPFSPTDVATAAALGLPAIKIASPDLVNRPLLSAASHLAVPLLLSTGAATLEEIDNTVTSLSATAIPFALLHCVSSYPTPSDQAHLCWIPELARRYAVPIGYSDHTTEAAAGALAVAAGACILERHLTYDCTAAGPDHAASSDPTQFAAYVEHVRFAELLLGAPGKHVLAVEQDVRRVSRQSLVLRRDLPLGSALNEDDLTPQRPGTGIPAAALAQVISRRTLRFLPAGTLLTWEMLTDAA